MKNQPDYKHKSMKSAQLQLLTQQLLLTKLGMQLRAKRKALQNRQLNQSQQLPQSLKRKQQVTENQKSVAMEIQTLSVMVNLKWVEMEKQTLLALENLKWAATSSQCQKAIKASKFFGAFCFCVNITIPLNIANNFLCLYRLKGTFLTVSLVSIIWNKLTQFWQ